MLDFRIVFGAIVIFASLIVIGVRIMLTSDTLNVALGDRPEIETSVARHAPALPPAPPPVVPAAKPPAVTQPASKPETLAGTGSSPAPEVTGSIAPAPPPLEERAAKPKPRPVARKKTEEDPVTAFFQLFFPFQNPQFSGQGQQR